MQTKAMKPSEPAVRRLVFFCIRKKPRKKVKKSKSSLLRGVNHLTRQKAEQQNEGNLEGRGTVQ